MKTSHGSWYFSIFLLFLNRKLHFLCSVFFEKLSLNGPNIYNAHVEGGWGSWNVSCVGGFYCFSTIDLLFIFVDGGGWWFKKLTIFVDVLNRWPHKSRNIHRKIPLLQLHEQETPARVFSCEKIIYSKEHLQLAASVIANLFRQKNPFNVLKNMQH